MEPKQLPELATFACVVRHASFTRAAAELGVTRSAVSHAMRTLEASIGVRLLHRTTRSVTPTAAGQRLLAELAPALGRIRQAVTAAELAGRRPSGRLRLNVPRVAAMQVLAPAVPGFLAAHPDIALEILVDDAAVDIVAAGCDAGIRFGERLAPGMVAQPVGLPVQFAVVASPGYLEAAPPLLQPADLAAHGCIGIRLRGSGGRFDWEFQQDGVPVVQPVSGRLTVDSGELALQAALAGVGPAFVPLADARPWIESGRLRRCLGDHARPPEQLYLYYPSRRHHSAAMRALIDWLKG